MDDLIDLYLTKLGQYKKHIDFLYSNLEPVLQMIALTKFGFEFVPSRNSILEEIKYWPENAPPIPPSAWVTPRKGSIKLDEEIWEFAFHGAGLSFFHSETHHDISIEITTLGELGITRWTTQLFLDTFPSKTTNIKILLNQHIELFNQAIALGYLVKAVPLLGEGVDDQTFVFNLAEHIPIA